MYQPMSNRRSWVVLTGLILASWIAFLPGCALVPEKAPNKARIPAELLPDCVIPPLVFDTNADLATFAGAALASLRECNVDKAALREWDSGTSKGPKL